MPTDEDRPRLVADAAVASSSETTEAIDRAAAKNDDPEVAEALDEASVAAELTASRVGWLRGLVHRFFSPKPS